MAKKAYVKSHICMEAKFYYIIILSAFIKTEYIL